MEEVLGAVTKETRQTPAATRPEVLVREVLPAPGAGPEVFLRAVGAAPRGFFQEEGGWVAHAGAVTTVEWDPADEAPETGMWGPEDNGRSPREVRYREVERARVRLAGAVGERPLQGPPPRLHGGFAFHPRHRPTDEWTGFPAAGFVLPRFELHGGEGKEPFLVAQTLVDGEAGGEGEPDLRRELLALRARMAEGGLVAAGPEPLDGQGSGLEGVGLHADADAERARWVRAVEEVLEAIQGGKVSKAVLARILDVRPRAPSRGAEPVSVLARLRSTDPGARIFLWEPRAGRALVGAAPETLASVRHGRFHATAVAGSAPVGRDDEERGRRGEGLLGSEKDRMEHACTVEDMTSRLQGRLTDLHRDAEPHLLVLPRIQHLESRIEGRCAPGETVLSLVAELHPTPAVCGLPRDRALALLDREEPFHRGWYAGPVGWVDSAGDGTFVPALRSAVGGGEGWRLFAGAGVVEGSDPELEWDETAMKFEPMLRALGARPSG